MKTLIMMLNSCFFLALSIHCTATSSDPKEKVATWWHPAEGSVLPIPSQPQQKASPATIEHIPAKSSGYCIGRYTKYLIIKHENKIAMNEHVTVMRIAIIHEGTDKKVYVTPWSLINRNEYYDATYNPDENTITITWGNRPLIVLSVDELNKKNTPDLRDVFIREKGEPKQTFSPLIERPAR